MQTSAINEFERKHITAFCQDVRQCDIDEIKAACGLNPAEVLYASFEKSGPKISFSVGDDIVCVFGVTDLLDSGGIPWMIGTNAIEKHKKAFLKACSLIFPALKEEYSYLENYVDARNTTSIKWLKWLGFEVFEPHPFGLDRLPFHRFRMDCHV